MLSPCLTLRHLCVSCTLLNSTDPRTQGSLHVHRCLLPFVLRGSKEQLVTTSNCFLKPPASDGADLCSVMVASLLDPYLVSTLKSVLHLKKAPQRSRLTPCPFLPWEKSLQYGCWNIKTNKNRMDFLFFLFKQFNFQESPCVCS